MKIRKTRIKKTTKANGSVQYVAEYKWGFWWYQFDDSEGPSGNARQLFWSWVDTLTPTLGYRLDASEKQAKDFIDFYIARVNHQNASEIENKVVKVEYEGYP
jgi:hypothetical protein